MIRVYYTYVKEQLDESSFYRYLELLPQEMQQRILRFRQWQDAQASLFGKLLLSWGLKDMNLPYQLSEMKYTNYGRPYFSNVVDFNISHSGGCIACAFNTGGKIGIDIEEVRTIDIQDFKSIFHEDEWLEITASENVSHTFFHYWTAKEAIVKADGKGLNIPLKRILIKHGKSVLEDKTWHYENITLVDNYTIKVASDRKLGTIESIHLNF